MPCALKWGLGTICALSRSSALDRVHVDASVMFTHPAGAASAGDEPDAGRIFSVESWKDGSHMTAGNGARLTRSLHSTVILLVVFHV
jgi:hypothetical protein